MVYDGNVTALVSVLLRSLLYILGFCVGFANKVSAAVLSNNKDDLVVLACQVVIGVVVFRVFHSTIRSMIRLVWTLSKITVVLLVISAVYYASSQGPQTVVAQVNSIYSQAQFAFSTAKSILGASNSSFSYQQLLNVQR